MHRRRPTFMCLFLCLLLVMVESKTPWLSSETCSKKDDEHLPAMRSVGIVVDPRSRVGKEQKIAMEMAAYDLRHCSNLVLHFKDSYGNSASATSAAMELISQKQVNAIIGTLTPHEAELVSDQLKTETKSIPVVSITPTSTSTSPKLPSFIQMSTSTIYQTQCIAAIIKHFKWRKVISIHEQCNTLSSDNRLTITLLSDSLQDVGSSIESHVDFPCVTYDLNHELSIEKELKKLRSKNVKVFVVMQSSLEFFKIMFEKAKALGMMGKGYVWIVSDEIMNFLDSVDVPVFVNMQGVIGLKTDFMDASEYFREFKTRFRRKFKTEFAGEEENSIPSIYALRAYDSIWTIARALQKSEEKVDYKELTNRVLSSDFESLSGKISFENNMLSQKPIFRVVNVIGKGYQEVKLWSSEYGFVKNFSILKDKGRLGSGLIGGFNSISWPGGDPLVPKGLIFGNTNGMPLRIGVPSKGAFTQFVKVEFNPVLNRNLITGFSIDVFEAAVKELPYELHYQFVPFEGSYDEMVHAVADKTLDGAVGDTEIVADRFATADFTHPYIESGLVMVVTAEPGLQDLFGMVIRAFTKKMWIQLAALSLSSGSIIWCSEYAADNDKFRYESVLKTIGSILWLSLTIPYLATREDIETLVSRFVAIVWIAIVIVVGASFTAVLSSNLTVPRVRPSIRDIEFLQKTNAVVGCNGNSFIVRYLVDVLKFKPQNVLKIDSISDYPNYFKNGDIKAAFFVSPHAKVFLAEYCEGYAISGSQYTLGGFGFVFPKGSMLANNISEAILKVTQSGVVNKLEQEMLSSFSSCPNSSSKQQSDSPQIHWKYFFILGAVQFAIIICLVKMYWDGFKKVLQKVLVFKRMLLSGVVERFTRLGAALLAAHNVVAANP